MNSVIIFDVEPNNSIIVRERMRQLGYFSSWASVINGVNQTFNLPHNVVWKPNTETNIALADIGTIISQLNAVGSNVHLLRCIVLNSTPWNGDSGLNNIDIK